MVLLWHWEKSRLSPKTTPTLFFTLMFVLRREFRRDFLVVTFLAAPSRSNMLLIVIELQSIWSTSNLLNILCAPMDMASYGNRRPCARWPSVVPSRQHKTKWTLWLKTHLIFLLLDLNPPVLRPASGGNSWWAQQIPLGEAWRFRGRITYVGPTDTFIPQVRRPRNSTLVPRWRHRIQISLLRGKPTCRLLATRRI